MKYRTLRYVGDPTKRQSRASNQSLNIQYLLALKFILVKYVGYFQQGIVNVIDFSHISRFIQL